MPGSRHWCFTLNNYTDEEWSRLQALGSEETTRYLVIGREVGESGTPHVQGYVAFSLQRTKQWLRNNVSSRAHYETAHGTPQQAADYCKKDGQFEEYGQLPGGQGTRSDLRRATEEIRAGRRLRELGREYDSTIVRYHRGLERLALLVQVERDWVSTNIVLYGEPGTGKTRRVVASEPDLYHHAGGGWFDGYDGQEAALFDDFGGHEFKLTYLLKLMDQYPMKVPIKGGFVQWVPKRIYFTSNKPFNEWYSHLTPALFGALDRRVHIVIHLPEVGVYNRVRPE